VNWVSENDERSRLYFSYTAVDIRVITQHRPRRMDMSNTFTAVQEAAKCQM
jgi:hypothetical protein